MPTATDFALRDVTVSSTPLERFQEYLESRGKRITQQKRKLVEAIFKRHEHFGAEDLVAELSYGTTQGRISRPTVYRCLGELVEAGLLRVIQLPNGSVYEHDYGYPQHDHLYCMTCQKLIEFQSQELLRVRAAVAECHQFQVLGHRLVIQGICWECRRSRQRQKRPVDLV